MIDKELLKYFTDESNQVLSELAALVEKLERFTANDRFPAELLEEFSQKIDRIMGAAKTMSMAVPDHPGFQRIGKIAELCKLMGYKAAERKASALLPLFAAFWSDTIEVTQDLIGAIEDTTKTQTIARSFSAVLQKRLEWLLLRVDPKLAEAPNGKQQVEALLKSLGLG